MITVLQLDVLSSNGCRLQVWPILKFIQLHYFFFFLLCEWHRSMKPLRSAFSFLSSSEQF